MERSLRRWSILLLGLPALAQTCIRRPVITAASTSIAPPEPFLLRLRARAGDVRRYQLVLTNFIRFGGGTIPVGDSAPPTMRMTQFVTESVTAVAGDTLTLAVVMDSTRVAMPGLSLTGAELDSVSPRGVTTVSRMDARGRVLWARLETPIRLQGSAEAMRALLPLSDSSAEWSGAASVLLPEDSVRVGTEWTDTMPCPRAVPGCAGGMATTFRFERVDDDAGRRVAVISEQTDLPATTVDTPMHVTSGPMHMIGLVLLDVEAGKITGRTMTMTGTAHSSMGDMAMRMEAREMPVSAAPAGGVGPRAPERSPLLIRRSPAPTPTTIPDLIALYRTPEPSLDITACTLPEASAAPDRIVLQGPDDGFTVILPRGWRARAPRDSSFGKPETVLEDSAGSRIRVSRVVTATGRTTLNRFSPGDSRPIELPHTGPCRDGVGPAGSLWTFYAPDTIRVATPAPAPYMAVGDVITAAGRRYAVTVSAPSAEARDRLVRIAAGTARPQR